MSLIVEDGTGLANAESYISVADADAYFTALANAAWTGSDAVKEVALRKATRYIDANYHFRGTLFHWDQSLQWPRFDVYWNGVYQQWPVPRVKDACCELAVRSLTAELTTDVDDQQIVEETVGPISRKKLARTRSGQKRYLYVDQLLAPFTSGSTLAMRIDRA